MKNRWNIALGFYQNEKIARGVLQKLKAAGLKRSVYIHREHYGKILVKGHGLALSLLISIGLLTAFFLSNIIIKFVCLPCSSHLCCLRSGHHWMLFRRILFI